MSAAPAPTGTLSIATWNVNSIKARLPNVLDWLTEVGPDVVLLQEIKCEETGFPRLEIQALGYRCAISGQKSYNGVAILSKHGLDDVTVGLPGDEDDTQARYIEATVAGVRVASIYLPNGNPVGDPTEPSEKYRYKLAWMDRLRAHAAALLDLDRPVVLGGDYNVIPEAADCYDPAAWATDALFLMQTRRKFRTILNLGWTEAYRALHPGRAGAYTFWDYQGRAWQADHGIRIDHHLLSPQAADRLVACEIDRGPRGREKASDHTPVIVRLAA